MGASTWVCFTPWTDDAEAALQRLRRETFAAGDYHQGPDVSLRTLMDRMTDAQRAQFEEKMRPMREFLGLQPWERSPWDESPGEAVPGGGPPPRTVDEAVARAGDEGTHSILDITRTADFFAARAAAPLPDIALRRNLGTMRPDRARVEDRYAQVAGELDRWECVYLTVYRDGEPHELAFIGLTGD
jgi:hypothetical protein